MESFEIADEKMMLIVLGQGPFYVQWFYLLLFVGFPVNRECDDGMGFMMIIDLRHSSVSVKDFGQLTCESISRVCRHCLSITTSLYPCERSTHLGRADPSRLLILFF